MTPLLLGIIAVLVLTAAVDLLADKVNVAAPILMLLIGAGVSLLPDMPAIYVPPEVVLMVILPPLLYSAAVNMPVSDFRRNLLPISVLAIVLVVLSAGVIGFAINLVVPGIGIAACIALGAIVSPTDAVATSMVKKAGISKRVVTILEGEGLINDATALVILSSAIGAMSTQVVAGRVILDFLIAVVVAVIVGWVVGRAMIFVRGKIDRATPDTVLSLATPFIAFLPAEHFHASGLVAAVVAGLVASQRGPRVLTPTQRISSKTTWDSLMLILELAVFLIMGLELTSVIHELQTESFGWVLAAEVAAMALAILLLLRTAVIMPLIGILTRRATRKSPRRSSVKKASKRIGELLDSEGASAPTTPLPDPGRLRRVHTRLTRLVADWDYRLRNMLSAREGGVMVWAGMRGAITLAAAQTLPRETPHRSFLVFVAFLVATASLLIQGTTLRLAVRVFKPAKAKAITAEERAEIRRVMHDAAQQVPPPAAIRDLLSEIAHRTDADHDREQILRTAITLAHQESDGLHLPPIYKDLPQLAPLPKSPSKATDAHEDKPFELPDEIITAGLSPTALSPQAAVTSKVPPQIRRRLRRISHQYALDLIHAQRTALLNASDAGLFDPEAVSEALDRLDADELSLQTRVVPMN